MGALLKLLRQLFTALVLTAQGLLDLVAVLLGSYYSLKFAAVTRRLGLPLVPQSTRRGFVIVQVDGLSGDHLGPAMAQGYAPHLQRMLRRQQFRLVRWDPGLPCTTPAVQSALMFGNNDDVPGFRWYDRAARQSVVCTSPAAIHDLQERLAAGRIGILRGGSSYMNMFDGEASLSMFTLGAFNRSRFFQSVRGMGFLLLFVLNPFRSVKTLLLALWEYLTDLTQRTMASAKGTLRRPIVSAFPFLRVMANVVFREIQTFAVLVDVYRGVPAIYTTYYGYDELAHQYGPLSKPALRALHAIDTRIGQIDSFRRLGLGREYDLFILSDHGMTRSRPFDREFGQSLGETLSQLAGSVAIDELRHNADESPAAIYLQEELQAIERNVRAPLSVITRRLRRMVQTRTDRAALGTLAPAADWLVSNSGPLAHIYLNTQSAQMDLDGIMATQPGLVASLAAHPGIGLVIGRQQGRLVAVTRDGALSYAPADGANGREGASYTVEGIDPLATCDQPKRVAAHLWRLAHMTSSGDLIVLGRYDPESDEVLSFESQWACHGGLGGPQNVAFALLERHLDWELVSEDHANELYWHIVRRYGLDGADKQMSTRDT